MPNKFLIETALDIGISNLEKSRKTDPKKLYDEVKLAINTENSQEIKDLYGRYIALYEGSVASTVKQSGALSEEVKWKNISDLRTAVESGGKNLKPQDFEGLNQFALVTYSRMSSTSEGSTDAATMKLLGEWFQIYQKIGPRKPETVEIDEAMKVFIKAFLEAKSFPFNFRGKVGDSIKDLNVESKNNTLIIGEKTYVLKSDKLTIKSIKIDANNLFIDAVETSGKSVNIRMNKREFVDRYLQDILGGKTIMLHQKPVLVIIEQPSTTGTNTVVPVGSTGTNSPVAVRPQTPDGKKPLPIEIPNSPKTPIQPPNKPLASNEIVTTHGLYQALLQFRRVISANAEKVGRLTPTMEITIEKSQKAINDAYENIRKELNAINPAKLSPQDKVLYDAYLLEVARYYADEHTIYQGIGAKNRYWKNYDRSLAFVSEIIKDDFKRWNITIPSPPNEGDIRKKIKQIDPQTAEKMEVLFQKGYSWGDIISNPKIRGAWDEIANKVITDYEKKLQKILTETNDKYKNGLLTFKDDTNGARKKAFELMMDTLGSGDWWNISAKNRDKIKDTGLIIGSVLGGVAATTLTGGLASGLLLGATVTTAGTVMSKGRIRDGQDGIQDVGYEFLLNGITFGVGGAIAKIGGKLVASSTNNIGKAGIILAEGTSGVALGASVEKARAWYEGVGLSWTEAIQNNFLFAFLPLGIQYRGVFRSESQNLAKRVVNNNHRAEVSGATPTVKAEAESIAKDARELGKKVQAEQVIIQPELSKNEAGTTKGKVPSVKIGEKVSEAKNPTSPISEVPVPPKVSTAHETVAESTASTPIVKEAAVSPKTSPNVAHSLDDVQFSKWISDLVPKVDKKKFPPGSSIKSGDLEIIAGEKNKYILRYKGKEYNYDSHSELSENIGKIIKTPEARLAIMNNTNSNRVIAHMKSFDGQEIPGVSGLRWKYDGEGKLSFQKKDPDNGSWNSVKISDLTEAEQLAAVSHWYGVKPQQIKELIKQVHNTTFDDVVSHAEQKGIIQKYGQDGLNKVKSAYNSFIKELKDGGNILLETPGAVLSTITGRGESGILLHNTSWQKAIGWSIGTSIAEAIVSPVPGSWNEEIDLTNGKNWAEAAAYMALVKFFGPLRFSILYSAYSFINIKDKSSSGSQVPS